MKKNFVRNIGHIFVYLFIFIIMLLFYSFFWEQRLFGDISMEEIVFTLTMSLKGTPGTYLWDYFATAILPTAVTYVLFLWLFCQPSIFSHRLFILNIDIGNKNKRRIRIFPHGFHAFGYLTVALLGFAYLLIAANCSLDVYSYVSGLFYESDFIEENYVNPGNVTIFFPEEKRNLIWIYMESMETDGQDAENGGIFDINYTPELTQLAKENISFSQSDKIEGAYVTSGSGWTIGGLVSQTAGIPLKIAGDINQMDNYQYFLTGAKTLGDILKENGYTNYFMAGSDFSFGGRTNYFTQHGNYEILDWEWAREQQKIDEDYYVFWGFEDQKLYSFAQEKLLEISKEDEPFNFSMLTVDTHPLGYLCDLCGDSYDEKYMNVLACASLQVYQFVRWIQEQDFYENTTIIITGDHCYMHGGVYGDTTRNERRVYNVFINTEVQDVDYDVEKNRRFTTLDFFPTALASIGGGGIGCERLGLGTNLFSGEETLAEKYGYEYLDDELSKRSSFYNSLLYP